MGTGFLKQTMKDMDWKCFQGFNKLSHNNDEYGPL